MARLHRVSLALISTALLVTAPASAPAALPAGPISSLWIVSTTTLKPGVTLIHYRATVSSYGRTQDIWKVAWTLGNSHVKLTSRLLGRYHPSNQTVDIARISSLAGTPGLVAALNGDFSAYTTPTAYRNSGILVRKRRIYNFGWGGNGVGYLPNGNFVMGHPTARATQLLLPNAQAATVGAWNALPGRPDQVGAYVIPGAKLTVPAGYAAFRVGTTQFRKMLRGTKSMTNPQGSGVTETVTGFTFSDPAALPTVNTVPITGSYQAATVVAVPAGGALLVTNATGLARIGLANLAARATPVVKVSGDAHGWGRVGDVMGGKPQLVTNGVAVSSRPASVDDWQWTCGGGCWRPALVRSTSGQGWLIVAGARDGSGVTMPTWAKMLKQLGAKDAMGFDNNGSAEMFHPGAAPIDGYGYERWLPSATALIYH